MISSIYKPNTAIAKKKQRNPCPCLGQAGEPGSNYIWVIPGQLIFISVLRGDSCALWASENETPPPFPDSKQN
jgi:hypothetical protein